MREGRGMERTGKPWRTATETGEEEGGGEREEGGKMEGGREGRMKIEE